MPCISMALTSSVDRNPTLTLTQSEQTVAIEFEFFEDTDVIVVADGVELLLGTHFTVSGGDGDTGSLTFLESGPGDGAVVNIRRGIPYDQPETLPTGFLYNKISKVWDRMCMQIQQVSGDVSAILSAAQTGDWDNVHELIVSLPARIVTSDKLGIGAVIAESIGASAVETAAIKDANVTKAKLNSDVFGTATGTACAGNDSRLSDARAPTNHTHASNKLAQANTHESPDTDSAAGSLHHTIGTSATQACGGNDARLSDTRTPKSHAASHQHSGADEVATATAAANAIPKAGAGGQLAIGWIPATMPHSYFRYEERQAAGTDGGEFANGSWVKRVLSNEVYDLSGIGSLASGQVTLPAGTYLLRGGAVGVKCGRHRTKIYNTTGAADIAHGETVASDNVADIGTKAEVVGYVTLAVESVIELRHRCTNTCPTYGLGKAGAADWGGNEVYAWLEGWKITV